MEFIPPLQPAILVKRYKRFLADIVTPEGQLITIHCANTGAMTGCATEGDKVWYSTSDNPKRKYPHSWELTQTQTGDWIVVNTLRANELVAEALTKRSFQNYLNINLSKEKLNMEMRIVGLIFY